MATVGARGRGALVDFCVAVLAFVPRLALAGVVAIAVDARAMVAWAIKALIVIIAVLASPEHSITHAGVVVHAIHACAVGTRHQALTLITAEGSHRASVRGCVCPALACAIVEMLARATGNTAPGAHADIRRFFLGHDHRGTRG